MTGPVTNPATPTALNASGAPSTEAQREQLRQAAQAFEAIFLRQMIGSMRNARLAASVANAADADVTAVNGAIAALQALNGAMRAAARGGSAGASLADERDRLIETIAERLDVAVTINGDGSATLKSGSDANVAILDGDRAALFSTVRALDGRVLIQVSTNGTIMPAPLSGGRLAGLVDVAAAVADRRATLDALTADIATTLNNWSADGLDANGAAGGNLLDASGGAAGMDVLITDPDRIAAATADGRPNGNLIDLEAVRATSRLEDSWGTIVSGNARQLATAKAEAAASAAWRDLSRAALDEVTGVDLDREAADLLRYQQAYNASARIIQVARETIDALFAAL